METRLGNSLKMESANSVNCKLGEKYLAILANCAIKKKK